MRQLREWNMKIWSYIFPNMSIFFWKSTQGIDGRPKSKTRWRTEGLRHLFSGNGVELENSEKLFLPAGVRRGFLNIPYVIAAYEATFSNAKGKYASLHRHRPVK